MILLISGELWYSLKMRLISARPSLRSRARSDCINSVAAAISIGSNEETKDVPSASASDRPLEVMLHITVSSPLHIDV